MHHELKPGAKTAGTIHEVGFEYWYYNQQRRRFHGSAYIFLVHAREKGKLTNKDIVAYSVGERATYKNREGVNFKNSLPNSAFGKHHKQAIKEAALPVKR